MANIIARAPYLPPQLGNQYNRTEIREQLAALARSIAPMVTRTVLAASTVQTSDDTILCDATDGAFTVTLPPPGQVQFLKVSIKKIDASANAVTVGGTVDGAANPTLATRYKSMTIQSDGLTWYKLASV